ncbi:MAG: Methyl-accepting chemotaxis protein McpB, partial [Fibrobacteres bacterium]|nr:Methyl-accepting chemotaxis protein McpB [Fibrobacterota bacterium]
TRFRIRGTCRLAKAGPYNIHMSEKTPPKVKRHPIRNFIIMPELQWPYIIRLLAIVNLAGVLMATSICALFYFRYNASPLGGQETAGIDMVNAGLMDVLVEENLMDVVVPAFVIADLVSLAIGLWLSLYFSRKISVPIYRVTRWAEVVTSGDLTYRLKFRPGDDLQSLEMACNQVSDTYAKIIDDMRRQITEANLPLPASMDPVSTAQKRARIEPSGA